MSANEPQFWDRLAQRYANNRITDPEGYERTLESVIGRLKSSDIVYEFGCGTGTTAVRLAPHVARYVAADFSPKMIAIGREKAADEKLANITFETSSPNASLAQLTFDVALGFNVLHLIPDRVGTLKLVHAALKPGGLLITKTPCLKEASPILRLVAPLLQSIGKAPYIGWFNAEELERDVAAAGFGIVERTRHGSRKKEPRIYLVARKA